ERQFNLDCAARAFGELKAALDNETPEMRELASLDGPTWIYLILSDCTDTGSAVPARMWHYAADNDGRGGLIKFHAVTRKLADGSVQCMHPTRDDFNAFVRQARDRILRNPAPRD